MVGPGASRRSTNIETGGGMQVDLLEGMSAHRKAASVAGVYSTGAVIGHPLESSFPRSSRQPVPLNNFIVPRPGDFLSLIKMFFPDPTCPGESSSIPNHYFPYICGEVSPRQH
jgi:hypothetical protein